MIYFRKEGTYVEEKTSRVLLFFYQTFLGRMLLKGLSARFISNLVGKYMSSSLSKRRIPKFIEKNHILMEEYEKEEYSSFNDFFTRKIQVEKRPCPKNKNLVLSPADSRLTVYPIGEDSCFWIKGSCYTLEELLRSSFLARSFQGGYCFVYRLCVDDYHRYAYVDEGKVVSSQRIEGRLHTVQPIAFKKYRVFHENTREYMVLKTENFKTIIQMEVGALLVGKICNHSKKTFHRGEEKGYFAFGGSTVIVLYPKDTVIPDQDILENSKKEIETKVKLLETVGRRKI